MTDNSALIKKHIVVIWQRHLPYHTARLERLREALSAMGNRLTAIEVASQDATYGFPEDDKNEDQKIICFPGQVYQHFSADAIHEKVLSRLRQLNPYIVFAPATAFPEGMAALAYRRESGCKVIIMDDAWEMTDMRGPITRLVKRFINKCVDGAFLPAQSHAKYFSSLNIPAERMVFGVDVVDNRYYATVTEAVRKNVDSFKHLLNLPESYFLFVGRFLKRKGIDTLIEAFRIYRGKSEGKLWDIVMVGDGPEFEAMQRLVSDISGIHFAGRRFGDELLACYAFAKTLVVPSERDPWALVVNEGMASGLPVIVSRGCGSAQTLVYDGENGWTFDPGDARELAEKMLWMSSQVPEKLEKMSHKSSEIISEWSLDKFVQGVLSAINFPRREEKSILSDLAVRFWKGRVSTN
jgi:glycosyltransferase involved in cell wall biosynthesis